VAIKIFELGIVLRAIDAFSAPLQKLQGQLNGVNKQLEATQGMRDAGSQMLRTGAIVTAMGVAGAVGLGLLAKGSAELEDSYVRIGNALGGVGELEKKLGQTREFVRKQSIALGFAQNEIAESIVEGLTGFLKYDQALAATAVAQKVARATSSDLIGVTKTLTMLMFNFSDQSLDAATNAEKLGDKLTAIQTAFKFSSLESLQEGLKQAVSAGVAKGTPLDQLLASLAVFSAAGLQGRQAGTAFEQTINSIAKASRELGFNVVTTKDGSIDLFKTLQGIQDRFGDIAKNPMVAERFEEAFGEEAYAKIALLLKNLDRFQAAMEASQNSVGKTAATVEQLGTRGTLAWEKFTATIAAIKESFGAQVLDVMRPVLEVLTRMLVWVSDFAAAHPPLLKLVAFMAALTAAGLILVGVLITIGGALLVLGSYGIALAGVAAAGASAVGVFLVLSAAVAGTVAIFYWLGSSIAAVWKALASISFSGFFSGVFESLGQVGEFLKSLPRLAFDAGIGLVQSLIDGIESGMGALTKGVAGVAKAVMDYLPWHSPADIGPLHALNRIRLVETIAERIQPAPIIGKMRRLAASVAIAAPLIAGPVGGGALAPSGARVAQSSITIQAVNVTNQITIAGAGANAQEIVRRIVEAFESGDQRLAKRLADLLEAELDKRSRREFS